MVEERDEAATVGTPAPGDGGDSDGGGSEGSGDEEALVATRQGPASALEEGAGEPKGQRPPPIIQTRDVTVRYGDTVAIDDVSVAFPEHRISAIIGPSGCGKSTLLRALNRMNDFIPAATFEGQILFKDEDVYAEHVDPVELRRRIGMVFQKPNPFPKSIRDNVAWGPKIHGITADLDALVEESLRKAALWDEVKDKLDQSGLALSGGQQQRLCIARAIAMEPEVILMDEPASALDPIATAKIEDLLFDLRERYTIVIVTHNMQQAARVSDYTAFLYQGRLIEFGSTDRLFTNPREQRTEDYITGKFG